MARRARQLVSVWKRLVFGAVTLAIIVSVMEAGAWAVARWAAPSGVYYQPRSIHGYGWYLSTRHQELGWPTPFEQNGLPVSWFDAVGARVSRAYPCPFPAFLSRRSHPPAAAVYGDSFVFGDGVGHDDTWPEMLSRSLGRRVDNFGVQGYGADQALLRMEAGAPHDTAPVVILSFHCWDIMRHVTQHLGSVYAAEGTRFSFRPRFVLGASGELRLVPIPRVPAEQIAAFARDPAAFLPSCDLAPGRPHGQLMRGFPHLPGVVRAFLDPRLAGRRAFGFPDYQRFLDPGHSTDAVRLTAAILARFDRSARAAGRRPIVVIHPARRCLEHAQATGAWMHQPLLRELEDRGVAFLDLGPALLEGLGGAPPVTIYHSGSATAHHTAEGNRLVAAAVLDHMRALGLVHSRQNRGPAARAGDEANP